MNDRRVVAALDIGGTLIKAALVTAHLDPVAALTVATPKDLAQTIGPSAARVIEELRRQATDPELEVVGCGVVVPGIVDDVAQLARYSVNLGWRDLRVSDAVAASTGLATVLGHDLRAALHAETRVGAAQNTRNVLLVALGTGIAGAMMVDGRLLTADGWAGELGHVVVDPQGPVCGCGARGCLEVLSSATAVARAYAARTGSTLDARTVAGLVDATDAVATEIWESAIEALARGVVTAVALTGAELVLVGGGLAESGATLLDPLRRAVADQLTFHRVPRIEPAALGGRAGCMGAACLAWDTV